ncbi:hypothetical protein [Mucilaginibacter xinganensis]|uniref:Uncharacterized protein n=1 Tax=Mucilaginibacter xinganensis TaxID=1234841 RepID=A0A223P1E7_9SPHI|nr:hypothetical protein [Mucilaginibacter xinganensis]ASU35840.1 hypothetical protein MuYL_3955 [Mucilaginibacter xinganensis]
MEAQQLPRARHIIWIILLGAAGLMGTISYLTWDLKMSAHSVQHWAVKDESGTVISGQAALIDTLRVVIHPNSMKLPAPAKLPKPDVTINYAELYLTYNTPFLIWMVLFSVTVACAMALAPVVLKTIRDIYSMFGQKWTNIGNAMLVVLLLGIFMSVTNQNHYVLMLFTFLKDSHVLLNHPCVLNLFICIGLLTGLAAMCGQLLINDAIGALPDDVAGMETGKLAVAASNFSLLRGRLKFLLSVDAAIIVLSILTTDALRRAIIQEVQVTGTNKNGIFPQEFAYMYGMVFTLYLALLYLPIYYRLRSKGAFMVRNVPDTDEGKKLSAKFLIAETPLESFKVALSILAPVVSALLPGIIKIV